MLTGTMQFHEKKWSKVGATNTALGDRNAEVESQLKDARGEIVVLQKEVVVLQERARVADERADVAEDRAVASNGRIDILARVLRKYFPLDSDLIDLI